MTSIRQFAESLTRHFELEKRRNARRFATKLSRVIVICHPFRVESAFRAFFDPMIKAGRLPPHLPIVDSGIRLVLSVRPKVAELAFHVFSRSLHPELYTVHRTRRIERTAYQAQINVTNCGHVITWTTGGKTPVTVCEVATSAHQPLPSKRCLISRSLKGSRTENADFHFGVGYRTHFQLEPVEPDMFFMVQQQLCKQPTEGLLHMFDASGRMSLGALSYINIETRQRSMLVQAIHTFPDDYAIVKVESLFALPDE